MPIKKQYRQGDVLVMPSKVVPEGAKDLDREDGKIVLAHGEVTGHSHAIESMDARFLGVVADGVQQRFLDVKRQVALRHEEHAQIKITRGKYEVIIQREYTPEAIRNVAD